MHIQHIKSMKGVLMKILIVDCAKLDYMPYVNLYLDNIDRNENEIHLLYWNRDLKPDDTSFCENIILHEFRCLQEDDVPPFSKIVTYWKYVNYAKKIIKNHKFDFIVALNSTPAVLLSRVLRKKYTNSFILDYRDSTYEHIGIFRNMLAKVVKASYATFVSSDGFRKYMPADCANKIFTTHNLLIDSFSHRDDKKQFGTKSNKIRVSHWGIIREEGINRKIIAELCNDDRFELHYYGREQQTALNLKKYVEELKAKNVFFHGKYVLKDRYEFIKTTDIIHNVFNSTNMMLAMSNKYYDSIIFRIPQLCMSGAMMGEKVGLANIGLTCDPYETGLADKLAEYYQSLDVENFYLCCDKELDRVYGEYTNVVNMIKQCFSNQE